MLDRLRFLLSRTMERLWVRPLIMCLFSLAGALLAKAVEFAPWASHIPTVTLDSLQMLLSTLAASMLVIATFAVGSMVASYASASGNATPRAFLLVLADDTSQNALSIFIGAFIFSLVSLVFLKNEFYEPPGRAGLFALAVITFAVVILTFVRWVDSIARLGRLGNTVDKVEKAARHALERRRLAPTLGCRALTADRIDGTPIQADVVGYVQRVDAAALQKTASDVGATISVMTTPGAFAAPGTVLAMVRTESAAGAALEAKEIRDAFKIGDDRTFDDDPRFGLIVLAEVAGRALSPGINDPGTAIDIIGTLVRLLAAWSRPPEAKERRSCVYDRVEMPELSVHDLFDDAFTAIARDGAGTVEVAGRLQKALRSLASIGSPSMTAAANRHSRMALARAEIAMKLPEDIDAVRTLAAFSSPREAGAAEARGAGSARG